MAEPDWDSLVNDASKLFVRLLKAKDMCPEKSIQRAETGRLVHSIGSWCRFVEDNSDKWDCPPTERDSRKY